MKQALRKVLAVLVVFSLVLTVGIIAISGAAVQTTLFADDFSAETLNSNWWVSGANSGLDGEGKFLLNTNQAAFLKNGTAWTDYTVQADVTPQGKNTTATYVGGIALRENRTSAIQSATGNVALSGSAYEFMLYKGKNDSDLLYVRLYYRGAANASTGNMKSVKNLLGISAADLNATYTLKVTVEGSSIRCYINDVLAFDMTDSSFAAGTLALKSSQLATKYDNILVTAETEEVSSQVASASSSATSSATDSAVLFGDDFSSDAIKSQWKTASQGVTQAGGQLTILASKFAYLNTAEAKAWTDYSVEVDITPVAGNQTSTYFAGISAREQNTDSILYSNTGAGYEFMLHKRIGGAMEVRLFRRNSSNSANQATIGAAKAITTLGLADSLEATYTLKMVLKGSSIKCYINNVLAFDVVDTVYTAGTVALKSTVLNSVFDNFIVRPIVEEEVSSAQSSSSAVSSTVTSSTVSSSTSSSAVSSTVTSSATTSSAVSSTVTSSGSASSEYTYPEGVYYEDDFTTADFLAKGWDSEMTLVDEAVQIGGGVVTRYLKNANLMHLTDYTVEADVMMIESPQTTGSSAGVAGRMQNGNSGYELAIGANADGSTYVRLYNRTSGVALSQKKYNVILDQYYNLKLVLKGQNIKGYVNNELIFDLNDATNTAGTAGFRKNGMALQADGFAVRASTDGELSGQIFPVLLPVADENGIYFKDTNDKNNLYAGGWTNNDVVIENQMFLLGSGEEMLLNAEYEKLTDYVVEAELMLDPDVVNYNTGNRFFRVVARNYEWTIQFNGAETYTNLRLYDRTNKVELATNTEFKAQKGQFYKLTLVVSGNRIMGYVDGKLWLDMQDDSNTSGPVGIRAGGGAIRARNFVVRQVTAEDLSGKIQAGDNGNTQTPNTGDGSLVAVVWAMALLMASALVLTFKKRRLQ